MRRLSQAFLVTLFLLPACAPHRQALGPVRHLAVEANRSGMRQFSLGNLSAAQAGFERALGLNRSIDNRHGALVNLSNLGALRLRAGDPDGALAYFQQGLGVAGDLMDQGTEADLLINVGLAHDAKGEHAKARSSYLSARELAGKTKNSRALRSALGRLGRLELSLQNWDDAEAYLREAYRLDKAAGEERGMALRESDLAMVALHNGRPKEAAGLLASALNRHRRLEEPAGVALDLQRLARLHLSAGELAPAEAYAERAFLAHRSGGNPGGAVFDLLLLSRIYHEQGNDMRAREKLDQARGLLKGRGRAGLEQRIEETERILKKHSP